MFKQQVNIDKANGCRYDVTRYTVGAQFYSYTISVLPVNPAAFMVLGVQCPYPRFRDPGTFGYLIC